MFSSIHNFLSGPTLRGKKALEWLRLPDPTKSFEERRKYITHVAPVAAASALAPLGPLFGFNVWLIPLCLEFYGPNAVYTMRNSLVLVSFLICNISCGFIVVLWPQFIVSYSSGVLLLWSSLQYNISLCLMSVAVANKSDVGLVLIGLLVSGPPCAVFSLGVLIKFVSWYREIGRPTLGAGIYGAILGGWAFLFSFWGAAIANVSVKNSFFYVAVVVFCLQIPGIFLLRSPSELPLVADATENENKEAKPNGDEGSQEQIGEPDMNESNETQKEDTPDQPTLVETLRSSATNIKIDEKEVGVKGGKVDEEATDISPENKDKDKENETEKQDPTNKAGFEEAKIPPLSQGEINRTGQAWIQFFTWIVTLLPGFAMKFTISPVLSALFGASLIVQSVASGAFLFVYGFSRFAMALSIGPKLSLRTAILTMTTLSPLCYFGCGAIVKVGNVGTGPMVAFIVLICIIGGTLGAKKIFITPVCLEMWGFANLSKVTSRAMVAYMLAALFGPLIMWNGLSQAGDIYIDPSLNTNEQQKSQLLLYSSNSLFILGAIACLAFFGFAFFVKPYVHRN